MRAIWAVYKRELSLFFRSPIVYAIAFGWLLLLGVLFSSIVLQIVQFNQQAQMQQQQFQQAVQTVGTTDVIVGTLSTFTFLLFIFAPLLTMRMLSEEAREGTLEVLMTLPMSDWAFVIGKFFAVWTVYTVILALTGSHMLLLTTAQSAALDGGIIFSAYLGAWLYGGATLAVTLIWSAITEDQIVAAFLGAATVLVLYIANNLAVLATGQGAAGGPLGDVIREISLITHYDQTMLQGIIRAEDVAYFLLLAVASLFITTLLVGTRRWRA